MLSDLKDKLAIVACWLLLCEGGQVFWQCVSTLELFDELIPLLVSPILAGPDLFCCFKNPRAGCSVDISISMVLYR